MPYKRRRGQQEVTRQWSCKPKRHDMYMCVCSLLCLHMLAHKLASAPTLLLPQVWPAATPKPQHARNTPAGQHLSQPPSMGTDPHQQPPAFARMLWQQAEVSALDLPQRLRAGVGAQRLRAGVVTQRLRAGAGAQRLGVGVATQGLRAGAGARKLRAQGLNVRVDHEGTNPHQPAARNRTTAHQVAARCIPFAAAH